MKIILDVNAVKSPLTGVGRYTLRLAQGLKNNPSVGDIKFFTTWGWLENIDNLEPSIIDGSSSKSNVKLLIRKKIPFQRLARKCYQNYTSWQFNRCSSSLSDYIYHGPNYQLMPFSGRAVVTIHDLSFIRHPEFHPKERVLYWRNEIYKVVERANHVITDSEFQRQEIIELLNVDPSNVSAVHLGVEAKFKAYSEQENKKTLRKYGLKYKEYSLVVATVEPRKNFGRLLQAFQQLPKALRLSYPLAIVGDKGWLSDDIHTTISRLVQKGEAVSLGYVEENDLPNLYAAASVFLYPSLYEGFGLPVLEAMACGTAVITSNMSSIPEVADDTCSLIDPYSVEEIVETWRVLLESGSMREKLSKTAQVRASLFSWDKCIENTIDIYSRIASK
jgi:glycosyltransferase involved in cell wall biosynthesis